MKLSYLVRGLPGHPSHPPLTDASIGIYTFATIAAFVDVLDISEDAAAHGWWLALVFGLILALPTVLTGFADWLTITWRSPLWWTATYHALVNAGATVCFGIAAITGHSGWQGGDVEALPFVLMLAGFCLLVVGGWLGGTIVFVHGMRVLDLQHEPTGRAVSPVPKPEKELAEGD